jgi:NADH-ubiquinone oxidoreductase chain 4
VFNELTFYSSNNNIFSIIFYVFSVRRLLRFLVKFPIFGFHLWLPKAHVEAPVAGSIILAAILLKLGGYGILRLSPFLKNINIIFNVFIFFSLMGGCIIRILCLQQMDIKVIIAYSSVAHIRFAIANSLFYASSSVVGSFLVLLAHGLASSGLFATANLLYENFKSRNLLISKGLTSYIPLFSL